MIKTKHFVLEATLNGVLGLFILDTGASDTCLDVNMMKRFGLDFKDSKVKASGAGSSDISAKISTKNTIKIGDWEQCYLRVIGINFDNINNVLSQHNCREVHGIIGADVIKKGKGIINYPEKKLYLK